jgi:predicted acyl esterase
MMTGQVNSRRLEDAAPALEHILTHGVEVAQLFDVAEIRRETVRVAARDGVRLVTDLYVPPKIPAPAIAMRTPYGRASDKLVGVFLAFARAGYVVIAQDCRGTGASEPDTWDYYMYESEDGYDLVEWVSQQAWFNGFLGSCGGSYAGQTQWCMAMHPRMSSIAPEVSGLGVAVNTAHLHMLINAYARSVGKGAGKESVPYTELEHLLLEETLRTGYFNEPLHPAWSAGLLAEYPELQTLPSPQAKRWLWEKYCALGCAERVAFVKRALGVSSVSIAEVESLPMLFGQEISHDAHTVPRATARELGLSIYAAPLMITGWYDWGLNDALATWELIRRESREQVRSRCRLIITPSAHNTPGYRERMELHPELQRAHRTDNNMSLLLSWYAAVREGGSSWPTVIYYLMGANEWRVASDWPVPEAQQVAFYLDSGGRLTTQVSSLPSEPDRYTYNPGDPTPTVGGSIVSSVYRPGSVDVSQVQERADIVTYTTARFEHDLDVVGPLRLVLFMSTSALDTDFVARLSDVFPDGRAIQLQNGMLRARYRGREPELLRPDCVYCLEMDLWATANRFKSGHRLRLDISSADFPRYDRNSNRGGEPGSPVLAVQTIYHDPKRPSHLWVSILGTAPPAGIGAAE